MNDYVESWEFYNKKDKSIARLIKDDYIQIDTDQKDTLYNTYKDDINKGWRKLVLDTDTYTYNAEEVIHSFLYDTNNSNIIKDMRQNERIPNLSGGFRQGFITQKKWDEAYQELISKTSAIMTYDAANAAIVVIEINETEKIVNGQVVFNTAKVTTALSTRMDLLKEKLFYNGFVYTLAGSTQKYLQPVRSEDITFVTNQLIAITSKGLDYVDTWNCFLYGEADTSYGFKRDSQAYIIPDAPGIPTPKFLELSEIGQLYIKAVNKIYKDTKDALRLGSFTETELTTMYNYSMDEHEKSIRTLIETNYNVLAL